MFEFLLEAAVGTDAGEVVGPVGNTAFIVAAVQGLKAWNKLPTPSWSLPIIAIVMGVGLTIGDAMEEANGLLTSFAAWFGSLKAGAVQGLSASGVYSFGKGAMKK